MATKKEIFEEVQKLCATHNAPAALVADLTALLEPKGGGPVLDIDAVTVKDADGNIVELQCSTCGVFLPATPEYFYESTQGTGVNGLKRVSRQADRIKKQFDKVRAASEKAILNDILDGTITPEDGKAKVEELRASTPDYSTVGIIVKTDETTTESAEG